MSKQTKHRVLAGKLSGNRDTGSCRPPVKLTRTQIVQALEQATRQRMGLSAKVMLRRYRHGKLADASRVADLIALSNLLRKSDPIFAE